METFMKKNALLNVAAVAALALLSACGCGSDCAKEGNKEVAQAEQVQENVQLAENTGVEGSMAEVATDASAEVPAAEVAGEEAK